MKRLALLGAAGMAAVAVLAACSATTTGGLGPGPKGYEVLFLATNATGFSGHTVSVRVENAGTVLWCASSQALTGQSVFQIGPSPAVLSSDGNYSVEWFVDQQSPPTTAYETNGDLSFTTELFHTTSNQLVFFNGSAATPIAITWKSGEDCPGN